MQRYGIDLTSELADDIVRRIQANDYDAVCKLSKRRTVFDMVVEGQPVKVVYSCRTQNIMTFLPLVARYTHRYSPHPYTPFEALAALIHREPNGSA